MSPHRDLNSLFKIIPKPFIGCTIFLKTTHIVIGIEIISFFSYTNNTPISILVQINLYTCANVFLSERNIFYLFII